MIHPSYPRQMIDLSQMFFYDQTFAMCTTSQTVHNFEPCVIRWPWQTFHKKELCCDVVVNRTQWRNSKCVWLSTSIIMNYLWWVTHCKCNTTEYRLRWQCEHKQVGSIVYASRLPIPNGFWVVWEGPPIIVTHLVGSERRREKGLKTVCIAARCTSVCIWVSIASHIPGS